MCQSIAANCWECWSGDLDYDRGLSFFADAPETSWADNGSVFHTLATIDGHYRPTFEALSSQEVTFHDARTVVLAPNVAYTIHDNSDC